MSPQMFLDGRVALYVGDCIAMLDTMEPDSVDCVVTSPPYWGLRDYGVAGQIGLEPTLGEHLAVMVAVFEAVRRVLKPTGTLWINYGDCYATSPNGRSAADTKATGNDDRTFRDKPFSTVGPITTGALPRAGRSENKGNTASDGVRRNYAGDGYLKPKDLCMIPNRLAIALQDAGWWVRSEIIWGKNNPMPDSSGAYRPSTAHEKIFLFTKSEDADVWRARDTGEISFNPDLSERCPLITDPAREGARWLRMGAYYDAETVKQGRAGDEDATTYRGGSYVEGQPGPRAVTGNKRIKKPDGWDTGPGGHGSRHRNGREAGKVIEVADKQTGHSRRHAGFNERWEADEQRRSLTPRHDGHINHTGLDELGRGEGRYLRNYEPAPLSVWEMATQAFSDAHFATFPPELAQRCILAGCPKGGLVLDPFGGAGTTALVALRHHRRAALIELNPTYAEMARSRIETEWRVKRKRKPDVDHGPLFGDAA
ncbi:site-specific DNA-methyltransferase [Mesorhizobium sp. M5C.F.Ca.IN.020.29.1.1]|uniref:site-specific DNA-methyltransferase n=1 Tax=unclassified Mesorhizobium TaxID=325217 RepID=UPI000FC9BD86|nr:MULTISPECIES: site-specific DNA-methyltransferase [unclassified Mesorhizobium]RUV65206.1 site-specific DNA-methyltransferase [Mesorhizobium sp. M5C.F.Ca.IN.020.29.1.1]TIM87646.1 MAG: site-specific DNA-methyltransferase [Mesorhizobium sp.]